MARLIFPLVLLIFCATLLVYSREYIPEAKIFPWFILIPATGMLLWLTGKEAYFILRKGESKHGGSSEMEEEELGRKPYLLTIMWLFTFIILMYLLGLVVGMPLFILVYLKVSGIRWRVSIMVPLLVLVFFYGFFVKFMSLYIYQGLLAEIFLGWG